MKKNKKIDLNKINDFKYIFWISIAVLIFLNAVIFISGKYLMIPTVVVSCLFILYFSFSKNKIEKSVKIEMLQSLSAFSSGSKTVNTNIPIPMVITDSTGDLLWYNDKARNLIDSSKIAEERNIDELIPGLDFSRIKLQQELLEAKELQELEELDSLESTQKINPESVKKEAIKNIEEKLNNKSLELGDVETRLNAYIDGKYYDIVSCKVMNSETGILQYMIYLYETSFYKEIEERYKNDRAIVCILEVDSYEDLMNELKEDTRPKIQAEIEETINSWAKRTNAMIRKFDKAKYIVVMSNRYFQNVVAKRFEILDTIREIEVESSFPATLSIGVCTNESSYFEMEKTAFSALEIALGRGGDQAAVKTMGEYEFYGGKSKAIEKRNKVKARIIAHAFKPILDESSFVYIMGHQYPDMDAFGAAIGIQKAATDRGKEARIVLEEANQTIISVYNTFKDDAENLFIKPELALQNFRPESDLVVVVDTHRPSFVECPELIKRAERKVVVDHHRRSVDMIDDTLLTYLEPYASSACELVTEMLQYMEKKPSLHKNQANALLAGMVLDTKNFSVQSGVRTFETAALLRRLGADTMVVKEFMQDDIASIVARSNIVANARNFNDYIAISVTDKEIPNPRLIAAQAADLMLTIKGITASFVIVKEGDTICISGRSLKDVNVQLIMEKMGGGGHRNGAGTQISDMSIDEVESLLLEEINNYIKEEEK